MSRRKVAVVAPSSPLRLIRAAEGALPERSTQVEKLRWAMDAARREQLAQARDAQATAAHLVEELFLDLAVMGRAGTTPAEADKARARMNAAAAQLQDEAATLHARIEDLFR
jgi:hypothetical protein